MARWPRQGDGGGDPEPRMVATSEHSGKEDVTGRDVPSETWNLEDLH